MRVRRVHYNDEGHTSQNSIARAITTRPEKISPAMVHLSGKESDAHPLSFLSEGMGNTHTIKSNEYEYDVNVRMRKTRPLLKAVNTVSNATGKGFQRVKLVFPDRWFIKDYNLTNGRNTQVRIMEEPYAGEGGYVYTVQIAGKDPNEYIPDEDLQPGKNWAQLFAAVGQSFSRGNASNWQSPATIRHKLTTVRKSYHFDGNHKNYVADFEFNTRNGKKSHYWMDWEEYQHYVAWMEECESLYWYGKQNYDENGQTTMVDERGQPVIIGPALLEQIQNDDTRSELTFEKLKTTIGDTFFGMTDGRNRQVTIFTGTGGFRDFDGAMKGYLNDSAYAQLNDRVFINDSGEKLQLGNYFKSYKHVDGHVVNLAYLPLFDHGAVAQAAPKHPKSGFPLESHRMVFVDQTQYEGENNLQMIYRNGREMKRWAVSGSVVPNGFSGETNYLRASDVDGASVHFLKEASIVLKRYDTSIDLKVELS